MIIKRIRLKNFRNYKNAELSLGSSGNIFMGENAQGKTNIIEAAYMCAFAKSFRTHNSSDMIMIGCEEAEIMAEVEIGGIDKKISIVLLKNGKKIIKKNNKIIRRTAELLNNLVVVVFSPEDLRIIKENPEKRRNFIDKEISQIKPAYYECLKRYKEALREKNTVLKEKYNFEKNGLLDIYDEQLAKYGIMVVKYRKKFIEILNRKAGELYKNISGGKEELHIEYEISVEEDGFYETILKNREKDIYCGYAGKGPHRDDLEFYIKGKDAKKYGSQGQQRSIALALKLAEIEIARDELGESPVLLLDDVLSELDAGRQEFLLNEIKDTQILITSTDVHENILRKLNEGNVYKVKNGEIIKII